MLLRDMLEGVSCNILQGGIDKEITVLTNDSRKAAEGSLFVCICGTKVDSHDYIPQVAANGAAAIVVEKDLDERICSALPADLTVIRVESSRMAMAYLSAAWFGHPTRQMKVIGITGTKGKTTTSYMLKSILEKAGHKVGLIGTNGTMIGDDFYQTKNTTPDSYELQGYFRKMADSGCDFVVMEVSSQGLMMHRVDAIDFDLGIFTNISPDHISPNEHKTYEEYRACKGLLFRKCRVGIVNTDDPDCDALTAGHTCELLSMGMSGGEDYSASKVRNLKEGAFMGVAFCCKEKGGETYEVKTSIPGLFSVYNSLAAASAARFFGVSPEAVNEALSNIHVNGRMEIVYASDRLTVIVDYAHNGVSAHAILKTLRDYKPTRLVVVFGCGGNRAAQRRIEMGEAAGSMADISIITADNSRFEKVEDIMKDIHKGFDPTGGNFIDIPDRREAIRYSILNSEYGDVVAIIGKGHEDYQEINGVREHFLDREEAEAALREAGLL
ncbi:MAG: UDP-N-acetylmuramoyl-L-alanyl-D-glutamate--2,6-diaminopimelate ligase [Lachnospiraceae bacterium]|nr:UDP-N-acetylmuramoyl-L-alanyl-D-glutamate--2,6-diaminopimelate ligase [Lachnospiraceae bacterium]